MGVKGLWKLIEHCGVPVPLETLEHKTLGVDVSIWLHQAVRGFRGPGGAAVANAHLLTLFHRICKLLFYRIRPVFIFDGGVPHLKKQTLAARRLKRDVAASKAKQVRDRLLTNLLKSHAVRKALGKAGRGPSSVHVPKPQKKEKDMFELPPIPPPEDGSAEMIESPKEEKTDILKDLDLPNLHHFDYESGDFKSLPVETQEVILSELGTTRKQNSWASINEMPQEGKGFAEFQMNRLMKRRQYQVTLEATQEEIRKKRSIEMEAEMFGELEKHVSLTQRIISEDSAHSILVKKVKDDVIKNEESIVKKEEKGKSLMKKKNGNIEKDFLTEFAKQGITKQIQNSDSDSDIEDSFYIDGDEEYGFCSKKTNMEEDGLLQIVGSLMENNGLTQDEILALIKQDTDIPETNKKEIDYGSEPSTSGSAPGFVYNPDAESSDDDSDLVEITCTENVNVPGKMLTAKEDLETTNVDKILETKNNSLWMKIVQQKLDDMVHKTTDKISPKKAYVDTRKPKKIEETKNCDSEKEQEKIKSVAISLDFDIKPLKMEDDIFADIFTDINALPAPSAIEDSRISESESFKIKNSRMDPKVIRSGEGMQKNDSGFKKLSTPGCNLDSTTNMLKKSNVVTDPHAEGLEINLVMKEKIQDLVKLEIEKMISPQSKVNTMSKTIDEEQMSVDDVEIMSSSEDSDMEDLENNDIKPDKLLSPKKNANKGATSRIESDDDDDFVEVNNMEENEPITKVQNNVDESKSKVVVSQNIICEKSTHDPPDDSDDEGDFIEVTDENESAPKYKIQNIVHDSKTSQAAALARKSGEEVKKSFDSCQKVENSNKESENNDNVVEATANIKEVEYGTPSSLQSHDMVELEDSVKEGMVENNEEVERPLEYSKDELKHLEEELASEQEALVAQAQKVERIATNLNDQMYGEAQELLQLFGIPYLVAPMEAEAQCAFLNAMKLTTGTITDDSDIFLFGGSNVYKNFFNQTKHVEFFKTENIKANIGLDRDKMISLALLTGSDYTVGVESVGAVLAMEVLAEFPGDGIEVLKNLKKWWNIAHKSVSASYQSKVKQRMSQIMLPESFPNSEIFEAYYKPEVDESLEKFSWAIPNVDALREFTMQKFGWNRAKADEILIPVMKKLGIKTSQTRIDSYYTNIKLVKENKVSSKRIQDAIARNKGEIPLSVSSSSESNKRKKSSSKGGPKKKKKAEEQQGKEDLESGEKDINQTLPEKDEQSPKKPSRTLLIDPSESSSALTRRKRGRPQKKAEEGECQASGPSFVSADPGEEVMKPKRKVTKEDMYIALLEKEKIAQREADKKGMEEKKRLAAQILKDKLKKQKR